MAKHNETGAKGEAIAAAYLRGKGYKLLAANWRSGRKEVDIICANDTGLVMIEVKTRSGYGYGFPEEAVESAKMNMLRAAAAEYIELHPEFTQVRFDVISILLKDDVAVELLHLEDAFL